VESNPPLRRPWFAPSPVTFDEVMDALLRLDCMTRTAAAAFVERVLANSPADR